MVQSPVTILYTKRFTRIAGLFALLAFVVFAHQASAASLRLNPPVGTYVSGEEVSVDVLVDTQGRVVNAISGTIRYPDDLLEAVSVSKKSSLVNLWLVEPSVSLSGGEVSFEGLILNPGFVGEGKIITINFDVKTSGTAVVEFGSGLVLANDGLGTNIVTALLGSDFNLISSDNRGSVFEGTALPPVVDAESVVDENRLPPVVINYSQRPVQLEDFSVRGITYPNTTVNVYLKPENGEPSRYGVVSDSGGNFSYEYGRDSDSTQLILANVFSVLGGLASSVTRDNYQFWLTAVRDSTETEPTQAFDVVVGRDVTFTFLVTGLVVLLVMLILFFYFRSREKEVIKEVRKDVGNLSYDIEKYEAKDRQDANRDIDIQ